MSIGEILSVLWIAIGIAVARSVSKPDVPNVKYTIVFYVGLILYWPIAVFGALFDKRE